LPEDQSLIPMERIALRILVIRGKKVMLDEDLARLYRVETRRLVEAVKRNITRFPADFMFRLTRDEYSALKSQIVTSNAEAAGGGDALISQFATSNGRGGRRKLPPASTRPRRPSSTRCWPGSPPEAISLPRRSSAST
jgi:hypothetical protein